jgi:hypothetical protein
MECIGDRLVVRNAELDPLVVRGAIKLGFEVKRTVVPAGPARSTGMRMWCEVRRAHSR